MKITFYINNLSHGGAERVMLSLAKSFAEEGNIVTIVTMYKGLDEYDIPNTINRVCLLNKHLDVLSNKGFLKRLLRYLLISIIGYLYLRLFLIKNRPDVLISFLGEANKHALISSLGMPFKKIVSVRNDPNKEYEGIITKNIIKKLFYLADGIVFQTEQAREWFPEAIQKKSIVIPNPIDDKFFNKVYYGERQNIVSVGRLTEAKNHELLIRSFADIANKINDNLIIYGNGPLRSKLTNLIDELGLQNRVFLPGIVADISKAIRKAKLFVLPSNYEGMPNSLMEAMALGIPCVATDCPCGGPRYLLGENEQCLFHINNRKELSNSILAILNNNNISKKISRDIQQKSYNFALDKIANIWLDFMESL